MSSERQIVPSTVPRLVGHAERSPLLTRLPVIVIAGVTMIAALVAGMVVRLADPGDFRSFPDALWWSVQTITTVGYGDIVPRHTEGRVIAAIVMLMGIALIAVVTATVTATLVNASRASSQIELSDEVGDRLDQISNRLTAIEQTLGRVAE
jgi:voltage-gated potassium channel Kch